MAITHSTKENLRKKGYTLLEILYALSIIGILSSMAVLNYSIYRTKACEAVSREDLRRAYSSAAVYFIDHPRGTLTLADLRKYGFIASPNVEVKIIHPRLSDLLLIASHNAPGAQVQVGSLPQVEQAGVPENSGEEIVPESRPAALPEPGFPQNIPSVTSALLRECDQETQTALKEAFAAARAYLQANPEGLVTKDILLDYGFSANENVSLTVVNGASSELSMSAIFNFPEATTFTIDSSGSISSAQ